MSESGRVLSPSPCAHKGKSDWCGVCGSYRPDRRVLLLECRHAERPFQWANYPCCTHCGNPHIQRPDGLIGHPSPCGQFDCIEGKRLIATSCVLHGDINPAIGHCVECAMDR